MNVISSWTRVDAAYPKRFLSLPYPPPTIWQQGSWDEHKPSIAIVGARACKKESQQIAETLAYELATMGISIISGGALGIDTAAHQGALLAGGLTCAVLGTGLDRLYPQRNQKLFEKIIINQGCLFSQFPLQSLPKTWHFPLRNELIAALSDGIVLIDSPPSSGSRYTVAAAQLLNKPIFVLSGAQETSDLLRTGAISISNTKDIFDSLLPHFTTQLHSTKTWPNLITTPKPDFSLLTPEAEQLYSDFPETPCTVSELCASSHLSLTQCMAALSELEIYGFCTHGPLDHYQKVRSI